MQLVRRIDKSDPPVGQDVKNILSMELVVCDVTEHTEWEDADPRPLYDSAAALYIRPGLLHGLL